LPRHPAASSVRWPAAPGPAQPPPPLRPRRRGPAGPRGPLPGVPASTPGLTRRQLTTVARTGAVHFVDMDAIALADPMSTHADDVTEQLTAQLTSTGFPDLCVLRLVNTAEQVRELPSQDRATLSGRIARLVVEVIHDLTESQGP